VDKEKLLLAISPERPAGSDLRHEDTYDRIKEARREDDPSLPQGVWQVELKRADWRAVEAICLDALATRTKDLQIAVWLLEAWVHLHGIAGANAGFDLLSGLCERFWPNLYPDLEGNNLEARTAPIRWVNDRLPLALKQVPVTRPQASDVPAYTWLDWEAALHMEKQAMQDPGSRKAESEKKPLKSRFQASVTLTPTSFYAGQVGRWDEAIEATGDFEARLSALVGDEAPSLAQFKRVLTSIRQFLAGTLAERNGDATSQGEASAAQRNGEVAEAAETAEPAGAADEWYELGGGGGGEHIREEMPIKSRAEAYHRLAAIADYLMKVEPHSPAPYLIKRAVHWGSMSLTDLLLELVSSPGDRGAIYGLLGIKQDGG
jgi:type VI secretion system protein ImpA